MYHLLMGLLPSAAVMTICADMVDGTCGEYMNDKNKTFILLLQTYTGNVPSNLSGSPLGLTLSGQNAVFVLA
ncbi:MAG: hypothetical protein ACLTMD_05460 [Clostridium sp.]